MLQRLTLKATYESERDDLLEDFYVPMLSESSLYWRISAYFSRILTFFGGAGAERFLYKDGRMQFILGNELSESDFEQISEGYRLKETSLEAQQSFREQIEEPRVPFILRRILNVSKLIELIGSKLK